MKQAICLVCDEEFDPRPQPSVISYTGIIAATYPPAHFHELSNQSTTKE
jgi:hypothetical protein